MFIWGGAGVLEILHMRSIQKTWQQIELQPLCSYSQQLLKIVVWVSKSSVFLEVFHLNFLTSLHDYLQNNRILPSNVVVLRPPGSTPADLLDLRCNWGINCQVLHHAVLFWRLFLEVDLEKKWINMVKLGDLELQVSSNIILHTTCTIIKPIIIYDHSLLSL